MQQTFKVAAAPRRPVRRNTKRRDNDELQKPIWSTPPLQNSTAKTQNPKTQNPNKNNKAVWARHASFFWGGGHLELPELRLNSFHLLHLSWRQIGLDIARNGHTDRGEGGTSDVESKVYMQCNLMETKCSTGN